MTKVKLQKNVVLLFNSTSTTLPVPDLFTTNAKDGSVIPVWFTRLYITLLIILAVLLTAGQVLTQWQLRLVQDKLWVIRYTALQRHQSQQIVKEALQLIDPNEQAKFTENVGDLRQVFPVFERYHREGRQGRAGKQNVTLSNSDTIQQLYREIYPYFDAFSRGAHRLMQLQKFSEIQQPDVQTSLQLLLVNEKPFLEKIDGIVRQYTAELRAKLATLQAIEYYLYGFEILALISIGLLIFRPAILKLKETVAQLVEAETQTKAANRELLNANKSLKETRQKLFEATKLQYQQEIDDQKLRTSYLMAGQEEERKRLSRELHDGLGQMLTAIKLQVEGLEAALSKRQLSESSEPVAYPRNLQTLKQLITQTIQETRTISNNLMPTVLSDFGIVPALKMLAEQDRSETIDVQFATNLTVNQPRLDKNVEITVYRITQEAVSNAVKHANSSHIYIELNERKGVLELLVRDDGDGFSKKRQHVLSTKSAQALPTGVYSGEPTRPPSQGLHNIRERTKLLNGKIVIRSTAGKGTQLSVRIPLKPYFATHETY